MPAGDVDLTSCFSVPSRTDTAPTRERPTRVSMIAIDRPVLHYHEVRPSSASSGEENDRSRRRPPTPTLFWFSPVGPPQSGHHKTRSVLARASRSARVDQLLWAPKPNVSRAMETKTETTTLVQRDVDK